MDGGSTSRVLLALLFIWSYCGKMINTLSIHSGFFISPSDSAIYKPTGSMLHLKCANDFNITGKNMSLSWTLNNKYIKYSILYVNQTATATVDINRLTYLHRGKYECVGKETLTNRILARQSVEVAVGDLPPVPSKPIVKHLFGVPPVAGIMSYSIPPGHHSSYPLEAQLLISHTSDMNACIDSTNPEFQVVDHRTISTRSIRSITFDVELSSSISRLFANQNKSYCEFVTCDSLCGTVKLFNRYGTRYADQISVNNYFNLVECGQVDNLNVVKRKKTSLVIGWKTPKYMEKTHIRRVFYLIRCTPTCGEGIVIKKNVDKPTNQTINSLQSHTNYTLSVYCSIYEPKMSSMPARITIWTRQDAPLVAPVVVESYWLNDFSDDKKGIAFIRWEKIKQNLLRGNLESYKIAFQSASNKNGYTMIKNVTNREALSVNITLPMGNYTFNISACTGGGCGKESSSYPLKALLKDVSPQNPSPEKSFAYLAWVVPSVVIAVSIICLFIWYKWKPSRNEPPFPKIDLDRRNGGSQNIEETSPNHYSNVGYTDSKNDIRDDRDDSNDISRTKRNSSSSDSSDSTHL